MNMMDDQPWNRGKKVQSMVEEVKQRSLRVPGARSLRYQSKVIHKYGEQRMKMRARFELAQDGCTFSIKFAPMLASDGDEQYCLLTHGPSVQIWEMSGVYTRRSSTEMNAARMVQTHRQHTDMVSAVAWMPASFAESYPNLQSGNGWEKTEELKMPPYFSASFDKKIKMHKNGVCVGTIDDLDWVRFMDVDHEGTRLLTGSVGSNIYGWDTMTLKADWSIIPAHEAPPHLSNSLHGINSINGLEWMHGSSSIFASGAGDGSIKIWDTRTLDSKADQHSCIGSVVAHTGKLNNLQWLQDNRFLMTSGRDDVIRLLDLRMLSHHFNGSSSPSTPDWNLKRMVVQEYIGHACSGYNIQAALYENDTRICTGSRDGKIYIYDTWNGQIVDVLTGISQPTHLAVPLPDRCGPGLISSTATSCQLFVWAPTSTAEHTPQSDLMPVEKMDDDTRLERARYEALENTFQQFGDRFLKALRTEGPNTRAFFDEDVQIAYSQHLRNALLRHGRTAFNHQNTPSASQSSPLSASTSSQNHFQGPESSS